jgi:rhodanese-related sulfurtransferase
MSFLNRLRGSNTGTTTDVDVQTAHTLLGEGALLIDVREPNEFRGGHAAGARSIPLGQLADRAGEIAKDRIVLVICASGNRSKTARSILQRLNFADARNVVGGTSAWQRAGLPMKR